jgi:phosphate transport system substrate-binding protein
MVVSGTQITRIKSLGAVAVVAATIGLTADLAFSQNANVIAIDGSSTVFPITEAMAEEFMNANANVNITVGVSGTGGGFKKFCAGETDISNASRPIKESEIELCKQNGINFVEIPVAYDALTVVINPANTWAREMTIEELNKIWAPEAEGTITRWNQINPSWPNAPLSLFGPGADSGTFDYFTDEINGEEGASRGDYTASEDDNVLVLGVARDANALGYFGMAYYLENQDSLDAVAVDSGEGPVYPTPDNVENGSYNPLSRPIFIYVSTDSLNRSQVRAFVEYYLDNAADIVPEIGYVPLPAAQYAEGMSTIASN